MTDAAAYTFLLHHTPPPGFGLNPVLLTTSLSGKVEATSLERLSRTHSPLITHSFSLLVDWFRNESLPLPPIIIDIEVAKKLIVGRPKGDFRFEKPWDMASMLAEFTPAKYDSPRVRAAWTTHMVKPAASEFGNLRWMATVAAKLPILWEAIRDELEQRMELSRFEDVEVPAYNIMLSAQYKGIGIDVALRDEFLKSIDEDYFSAHYQLAIRQGVDVDRALSDFEYLNSLLACPRNQADSSGRSIDVIEARRDYDPLCFLLHSVGVARENRRILLRMGDDEGRCFPLYDTLGTVTGRIMAIDPHLQYLNKKYRNILVAGAERKLLYVDYAQFEPSIMASISGDDRLLALCNDGDLYENLAVRLCGNAEFRETVKLMFLAYSYGMNSGALVEYLMGRYASRHEAESIVEKRFLPLFSGIEGWKSTIDHELSKSGKIGTLLGCHRYRRKEGATNAREQRWGVSQVIQGTGALILKKVIIKIKNRLPEVPIVLPVFDALLVEVPGKSAGEVTEELLNCFREAFSDVCPFVKPSVLVKPFAESTKTKRALPV